MAKRTEYARWTSIMKKLDNQIKKAEEEKRSKKRQKKTTEE